MKSDDLLEVEAFIYGMKIGTLSLYQNRVYFDYDDEFRSKNINISPLKLNIKEHSKGYTNRDNFEVYQGMAGVFFDSLPDKHGMPFIYRYFENKGFRKDEVTLLHKLIFIADRGMGAIEYKPKEHQDFEDIQKTVSVKNMREDMIKVLQKQGDDYSIDMLMNIIDSASPIGGARPKMLVTYNSDTEQIKYNNKILDEGFSRAIIKFDEVYPNKDGVDESIGFTKMEYLYLTLAKECGIDVPNIYLHEENGEHHLIIERYDRDKDDNKIHTCSASGLMHKDISVAKGMSYEELFRFTNIVCTKQSTVKELYKRMVFNALAFNLDDHAKNFEFMMSRDGDWDLAPAYDITYSKGFLQEHLSTINGKGKDFVVDDFLKVAKENLIQKREAIEIIHNIATKLLEFEQRARELNISEDNIHECVTDIQSQVSVILRDEHLKDMSINLSSIHEGNFESETSEIKNETSLKDAETARDEVEANNKAKIVKKETTDLGINTALNEDIDESIAPK